MKNVWKSCGQPKVSFCAWEASQGKVLTLDQIKKRRRALANRCYFCQVEEESIDHLLLHCEKTRHCGRCFSLFLECLGYFRSRLEKPYWVGTASLWEKSARQLGERVLFAFFRQFGRQGIESPLKMKCCPSKG